VSVSESTSPADIAELKRQDADSEDLEETKESKVDEAPAPPLRLSEAPGRGVKAWPAKDDDEDEVQCKVCNNWVKGGKAGLAMHSQYSKKHATYKLYNDGMSWAEATKKADRQWKNQWRQERKRSYAASARSRSPAEEPSGKSGPKRDKKKDKEPKRREEAKKEDHRRRGHRDNENEKKPKVEKSRDNENEKKPKVEKLKAVVVVPDDVKSKPTAPQPELALDDSSSYSYYTEEEGPAPSAAPAAKAAAPVAAAKAILAAKPKFAAVAPVTAQPVRVQQPVPVVQAPAPVVAPGPAAGPTRTESLAEFYETQAKFLRQFGQ